MGFQWMQDVKQHLEQRQATQRAHHPAVRVPFPITTACRRCRGLARTLERCALSDTSRRRPRRRPSHIATDPPPKRIACFFGLCIFRCDFGGRSVQREYGPSSPSLWRRGPCSSRGDLERGEGTMTTKKSPRSTSNRADGGEPRRVVASKSRSGGPDKTKPKPRTTAPASKARAASPKVADAKTTKTVPTGGAPAVVAAPADRLLAALEKTKSLHDLFVSRSGTDNYAIFGPCGPILWSANLDLSKADLSLWRRILTTPATMDGATWRFKWGGGEYTYQFTVSPDVLGHVLAVEQEEAAPRPVDDGDENRVGSLLFAGMKYGNLYMVFAGSPTSFADDDFQTIHDALRLCGVAS